jgi:hypothetical protein
MSYYDFWFVVFVAGSILMVACTLAICVRLERLERTIRKQPNPLPPSRSGKGGKEQE